MSQSQRTSSENARPVSFKRLLYVDPSPIHHVGIAAWLKGSKFSLQLATTSVVEAVECLREGHADLIVCDFELLDGDAGTLLKVGQHAGAPLLLFSDLYHPVIVSRLVNAGASGLLSKTCDKKAFLSALTKLAAGKQNWNRRDVRRVTGALSTRRIDSHIEFPLTQREFDVLEQLSRGKTNKMIAESLEISYETVKEHVQHLLAKLNVNDRTQAAVFAVRRGLLN